MFERCTETWTLSIAASVLVGFSGLLPMFFMPFYDTTNAKLFNGSSSELHSCIVS